MCPTQPAKKPKDVLVVDATWENKKKMKVKWHTKRLCVQIYDLISYWHMKYPTMGILQLHNTSAMRSEHSEIQLSSSLEQIKLKVKEFHYGSIKQLDNI